MKQNKILSNVFIYLVVFVLMAFSAYAAQPVNLGTAGNFVILAKSAISTTGTTSITGDIGVSPAAASFITGFGLTMDASQDPVSQFSTSSLVTGKVYATDYTPPTPAKMTTAVSDMETAYTDAAGLASNVTELGAGNIGGMTLAPGVYKWSTGLTIPTDVTLSGSSTDVWIFQIAGTLSIASGKQVILSGGAQAKNIFWIVAGQTTLGTTSDFKGNILDQTAIVLNTGAKLNGRALAQTAVTLQSNIVTLPVVATPPTPPVVEKKSNSGSGGDSGSSGISKVWQCKEWSACNSKGISTQICTLPDSDATSIKEKSCTPTQTNAANQNTVVPTATATQTTDLDSAKQNTENTKTTSQDNKVITPTNGNTGGNQLTGQVIGQSENNKLSWWERFVAWLSRTFKRH
jgi:Ice-binding-like